MRNNVLSNREIRTILHRLALKKYKKGYRYLTPSRQAIIRKKLLSMV